MLLHHYLLYFKYDPVSLVSSLEVLEGAAALCVNHAQVSPRSILLTVSTDTLNYRARSFQVL